MCRFILYKGDSLLLADLLTKPAHSIINQSFDCRLRIDFHRPLNGDGFGIGWYDLTSEEPCIFTSVLPAWNNANLNRLATKIRSRLIFAHVRAATPGFAVSESNCHPFQYRNLMWMHNGYISGFSKIKRKFQNLIRDDIFHSVHGSTDSEWCFALFLNNLSNPNKAKFTTDELREALVKTIMDIGRLVTEVGEKEHSLLNFAVSDGFSVVSSRFVSRPDAEPASLFYSSGTRFESREEGIYKMVKEDKRSLVTIIASEPLTFERKDWIPVPRNTIISITPSNNLLFHPITDIVF